MGYRITMGKMASDGAGLYFTQSWILFDSQGDSIEGAEDAPYVTNQTLELEKNQIGYYECDIPYTVWHDRYGIQPDDLVERQIDVMVEEDDEILFMGYLTEKEIVFDRALHIYMTGILGTLDENQMMLEPRSYMLTCNTDGTWTSIVNEPDAANPSLWYALHSNSFSTNNIGVYTGDAPTVQRGTIKDLSDEGWQIGTAWSFIQKYFLDEYDGYLYVHYDRNPKYPGHVEPRMEYKLDVPTTTVQTIEYGKNLLDLEVSSKLPSDFCNNVFARGTNTTTKGFWIFKKTKTTQLIASAYNYESEQKYGEVSYCLMMDGNTTQDGLKQAAQEELDSHPQEPEVSLQLTAFDRVDAGVQTDRIGFMKKSHVLSGPHGIDGWYVCTKVSFDPADPGNKQYTYGNPPKKLTDQQNKASAAVSSVARNTSGIMSYLNID